MKIQDSEILRRSSVFRFVSDEHFAAIEPLLHEEHYEFGEVIVKQGDPANSFYVLTKGRARALKLKPDGDEIPLGVLKPGDSFGEAALAEGGTRNATVRCSTAVDVLRIDRDDFLQLVSRVPDLQQYVESTGRNRALQSFLYQFSNFGRLPAPVLRGMIDKLTPVAFEKGNLIIREGDNAGPLYVIEKGRARAFAGVNGRERNLAFYREGDFFGELSILNDSPRAASVEAFTDCQLLSLELTSVRDLRRRFPEFDKLLSERLARYEAKTEARVPLDFATELLPAETQVHDKVQLDGRRRSAEGDDSKEIDGQKEPFADERGLFRKHGKRLRKIDHIVQIDEMDCGAACLGMICRHFGRKVSLARIRQLCYTATDGTSLKAISRAATELGLAARPLKISYRNLPLMPLPAIVHWEGNHWIVLYDVDEQFARVADPALGLRKIPRHEFETKWTGYAALFDYTPAFEDAPQSKPTLAWILPFLSRFKVILLQALGLAVAVSFLQLLFPVFTQIVVEKDVGLLKIILFGMVAALVFVQLATLAQEYLLAFAAVRLDTAVLDFLSRKLLSLPMSYFTSRRTGDIQRRLDGARQVRQLAVQQGVGALLAVVFLGGAIVLMAIYSPVLTLVFLATTPLYAGLMIFSVKVLRPLYHRVEENQGKYSAHQIDAIKGIEAVKAAAAEGSFRDTMLNEFLSVSQKLFKATFIVMSWDSVLQTIGLLSTAIFLWVGAMQVIHGNLSVGGFVAFSSLTAMAYAGILRAVGVWDHVQLASVLLNRLNDIFEQEPEQGRNRSRLTPVHSLEGRIELRNVSFRYGGPEAPNILSNITIDLAPGR